MATIRPALLTEILRELDNTAFGKDLFEIKIQDEDFLIQVTFLPKRQFSYCLKELKEPVGNRYYFVTFEAPGEWMLETEEFQHENFATARGRIHQWSRRIEDDYVASKPGFEELEQLRNKMMVGFDAAAIPEGDQFTEKEKEDQDHRLDEIEEKIEAFYKEKKADQQQVNVMKDQIRRLKDAIKVLDKRTWMLAAANRILNIFKEVRTAVGEVQALTKDFDNLLPDLSSEEVEEADETTS